MNVAARAALILEAADGARRLNVDLSRRKLSVTGADERLEVIEVGLLQTDAKWASVTGIVRDSSSGEELPFVLIVDDSTGEVTLDVAGRSARVYKRTP